MIAAVKSLVESVSVPLRNVGEDERANSLHDPKALEPVLAEEDFEGVVI